MRFTIAEPPAIEPVSLEAARVHCRIDGADRDVMLKGLIKAAREHVETWTRRALITQTLDVYYHGFLADGLEIPRPPLQSVVDLFYRDTNGVEVTLPSAVYEVDTQSHPGRIQLAEGESWPDIANVSNPVRVRVTAGYGDDQDDVPEPLRLAILFHVQAHHDNDPQTYPTLERTWHALLAPHMVIYV